MQFALSVAANLKFNKLPRPTYQNEIEGETSNLFNFPVSRSALYPLPPFHPYVTIGLLYSLEKYCP